MNIEAIPRTQAARCFLRSTDVLTSYRCGAINERDALDMLVEAGQSRVEAQKKIAACRDDHERNVTLKKARAI